MKIKYGLIIVVTMTSLAARLAAVNQQCYNIVVKLRHALAETVASGGLNSHQSHHH